MANDENTHINYLDRARETLNEEHERHRAIFAGVTPDFELSVSQRALALWRIDHHRRLKSLGLAAADRGLPSDMLPSEPG